MLDDAYLVVVSDGRQGSIDGGHTAFLLDFGETSHQSIVEVTLSAYLTASESVSHPARFTRHQVDRPGWLVQVCILTKEHCESLP